MTDFQKELEGLINKYSKENESNTPDFILAKYLAHSLKAFHTAIKDRDEWYGMNLYPGYEKVGARTEELVRGLELILPLAKGYAAAHPAGSNRRYVRIAESLLAEKEKK